jgi:hypothetical protein
MFREDGGQYQSSINAASRGRGGHGQGGRPGGGRGNGGMPRQQQQGSRTTKVQCQICKKYNHEALEC